jgi:hypothetical protein
MPQQGANLLDKLGIRRNEPNDIILKPALLAK